MYELREHGAPIQGARAGEDARDLSHNHCPKMI
jgi:hypothetical protein